MTGRIVIDDVRPCAPRGRPAKAVVGEAVTVQATIFRDGHDILAARAHLGSETVPLLPLGNDGWAGVVHPEVQGMGKVVVEAWTDRHATWAHKVRAKLAAGQEVTVELAEGVLLVEERLGSGGEAAVLLPVLAALKDDGLAPDQRLEPALAPAATAALAGPTGAVDLTVAEPAPLWVDRERALVGAWYELFPRSEGGLAGTAQRVPALAAMGFDVLYLPPIHPIGRTFRKGRNNTLDAGPDDPGSPWAIGGPEGGHTAIHPDLGTEEDLASLISTLDEHGMELALDYALQCSPDHPWVGEHSEWFHHRPDGSIAYAENPPKKYQDIYPINFWPAEEADRVALWEACRAILDHWIARGVRIFRVDNPHTKPVAFWEWLLPAVLADHPDVLFLAEAFTRPNVMAKLAEVGFTQSYTYFTWRTEQHGEEGLRTYLEELSAGPKADYMRPNFWPNTPDILSGPLRDGPEAAFALRLVLAATLSPSYGIYSGYELGENAPASETNEEYLYSEKYEIKHRDWSVPAERTLIPLITTLNRIRRAHPAFGRLRSLRFHSSDNPQVMAYSKQSDDGGDVVLTVVTLDPYHVQESTLWLDLADLGMPPDRPFEAYDELTGEAFTWWGPSAYVRLEPWWRVAHILHLRAVSGR